MDQVCMRYVRRHTKVVLESGGLFMLDEALVQPPCLHAWKCLIPMPQMFATSPPP